MENTPLIKNSKPYSFRSMVLLISRTNIFFIIKYIFYVSRKAQIVKKKSLENISAETEFFNKSPS